jgi:salicylate hydroxylase
MALNGQAITIIGAGIAGLAVARACALRGAAVTVLEQAAAVSEVGAGLQISPNGAAVLRALGLGNALDAASVRAEAVALTDGITGRVVTRLEVGRLRPDQGWHFIHRADLIALLLDGAVAAGVQVLTGRHVQSVDLTGDTPCWTGPDGAGSAPLVIGADGLHSPLRAALNGATKPFFTGQVAWRAVVPEPPGSPAVAEVHMGPGRHIVSYPLRGGGFRNIVGVEERDTWAAEGWSHAADPDDLARAFAGFSPRVRGWLDRVEHVWLWGLFRHRVAAVWQKTLPHGAAAILGDAAHPTLPFLAQGANMALEDAFVLARALDRPDRAAALIAYQAARAPRCARIVDAASRNARAYHLSGPLRTVAHAGLRLGGLVAPQLALGRFDWLYDFDVTKS